MKKCKQRKRENICKTVSSDKVENEWILHQNVRPIDNHFQEMESLIETFGVNKPYRVCCTETWVVESSAEDLYVLDYYAQLKLQLGKCKNEGVAVYFLESLCFEIIDFETASD